MFCYTDYQNGNRGKEWGQLIKGFFFSLAGGVRTGARTMTAAPWRSRSAAYRWASPRWPRPTRQRMKEGQKKRHTLTIHGNNWLELNPAHLLLIRGGVRRHMGGGGGILRWGDSRRGGGRTVGVSTAVTVISCPSIWPKWDKDLNQSKKTIQNVTFWTKYTFLITQRQLLQRHKQAQNIHVYIPVCLLPPSMCFRAFSASSGVSNSM